MNMTKKIAIPCLAMLLALTALVLAKEPPKEDDQPKKAMDMPTPEQMKAMMDGMKKWIDCMKPGKEHEALEHFVGKWKSHTKMFGMPGGAPMESEGEAEYHWILGKRFLVQEYHGETYMPDPANMANMKKTPYEGFGQIGYNRIRNMYEATWSNTLGTEIMMLKGGADPSGQDIRMYGEMDEQMLNVYGRLVKFETRIINKDKHVTTIVDLHAGDDYKVLEITYERVK